jgi:hypothetical protein
MIFGPPKSGPPIIPERDSDALKAAHSDPRATLGDSAQFRENLRRRYDTPYPVPWSHGRLND